MRTRQSLKLLVIVLALLSAAVLTTPVLGQDDPVSLPSLLTIEPIGTQPIGTPINVTLYLKDKDGGPNTNKVLIIYLNNDLLRRVRTDDKGSATIRIGTDLLPGNYNLRADFSGTQAYLPSSASTTLTIRPAQVTIKTVPPLPNIPFVLNGEKFESDTHGVASIEVSKLGDFPLEVLLEPNTQISSDTRVSFDRWRDEFQPRRTLTIQGDVTMEAGFSVSHPVSQTFVDLENKPVDMDRIEKITLQGTDGSKFSFDDGGVRWLLGGRIARRQTGLEATQIMYSVESVFINGSNTVNRYQQRFFVEPNSVWPVQLLLYHATFRAADALFGFPIGRGIDVKYPDGHVEYLPFGKDNIVNLGPVPRGDYKVQVVGAGGMAPETPLALSRNQELNLKVVSTLNIGLGAGLGLFSVLGLVLIGRPYLPRLALRAGRDVATLRFLRGNAAKPVQISGPSTVRYLLPETVIEEPKQAGVATAQASVIAAPEAVPAPVVQRPVIEELEPSVLAAAEVTAVQEAEPSVLAAAEVTAVQETEPTMTAAAEAASVHPELVDLDSSAPILSEDTEKILVGGLLLTSAPSEKAEAVSATYPGYLGVQDSYYVGSVEGIGDVYQQTYIDTYSGVALVKLYEQKDSRAAADMLNNTVLPWFKQHNVVIQKIMTDRGREYLGSGVQKKHQYQTALAANGIEYMKTDSKDPQSNDICLAFHDLMRKEVYNEALLEAKNQSTSLTALQQTVDNWLKGYNSERLSGDHGETPLARFEGKEASV